METCTLPHDPGNLDFCRRQDMKFLQKETISTKIIVISIFLHPSCNSNFETRGSRLFSVSRVQIFRSLRYVVNRNLTVQVGQTSSNFSKRWRLKKEIIENSLDSRVMVFQTRSDFLFLFPAVMNLPVGPVKF